MRPIRTLAWLRAGAASLALLCACVPSKPCNTSSDCERGEECGGAALCCLPPGAQCGQGACCGGCGANGLCACVDVGGACSHGSDCCSGVCAVSNTSSIADNAPNRCVAR